MKDARGLLPDPLIKFMDRLRVCMRSKQLAYKPEQTYCFWVQILFAFTQCAAQKQ